MTWNSIRLNVVQASADCGVDSIVEWRQISRTTVNLAFWVCVVQKTRSWLLVGKHKNWSIQCKKFQPKHKEIKNKLAMLSYFISKISGSESGVRPSECVKRINDLAPGWPLDEIWSNAVWSACTDDFSKWWRGLSFSICSTTLKFKLFMTDQINLLCPNFQKLNYSMELTKQVVCGTQSKSNWPFCFLLLCLCV